jgi:hypothetical protein
MKQVEMGGGQRRELEMGKGESMMLEFNLNVK